MAPAWAPWGPMVPHVPQILLVEAVSISFCSQKLTFLHFWNQSGGNKFRLRGRTYLVTSAPKLCAEPWSQCQTLCGGDLFCGKNVKFVVGWGFRA